jgi:hypothetical protein
LVQLIARIRAKRKLGSMDLSARVAGQLFSAG